MYVGLATKFERYRSQSAEIPDQITADILSAVINRIILKGTSAQARPRLSSADSIYTPLLAKFRIQNLETISGVEGDSTIFIDAHIWLFDAIEDAAPERVYGSDGYLDWLNQNAENLDADLKRSKIPIRIVVEYQENSLRRITYHLHKRPPQAGSQIGASNQERAKSIAESFRRNWSDESPSHPTYRPDLEETMDYQLGRSWRQNEVDAKTALQHLASQNATNTTLIVGLPATGKTTLVDELVEEYDYVSVPDEFHHHWDIATTRDSGLLYVQGKPQNDYRVSLGREFAPKEILAMQIIRDLAVLLDKQPEGLYSQKSWHVSSRAEIAKKGLVAKMITGLPLVLNGSGIQKLLAKLAYLNVSPLDSSSDLDPQQILDNLTIAENQQAALKFMSQTGITAAIEKILQHLGTPEIVLTDIDKEPHELLIESQSYADSVRRSSAILKLDWLRVWHRVFRLYLDDKGKRYKLYSFESEQQNTFTPSTLNAGEISPWWLWKQSLEADPELIYVLSQINEWTLQSLFTQLASQQGLIQVVKALLITILFKLNPRVSLADDSYTIWTLLEEIRSESNIRNPQNVVRDYVDPTYKNRLVIMAEKFVQAYLNVTES